MYLDHVFGSSDQVLPAELEAKKIQLKKAKSAIDGIDNKDVLFQRLRTLFMKVIYVCLL